MIQNFEKLVITNTNGKIEIIVDGEKCDLKDTTEININLLPGICIFETTKQTHFTFE